MPTPDIMSNVDMRAPLIHALHWIVTAIEAVGVIIVVMGAITSTVLFVRQGIRREWEEASQRYKANLGRGILLGLEFLIAADIIGTVAVTPTFQSLGVLALTIAIRTFLSFSLEVEIEGHWPWRRSEWERSKEKPLPSNRRSSRIQSDGSVRNGSVTTSLEVPPFPGTHSVP